MKLIHRYFLYILFPTLLLFVLSAVFLIFALFLLKCFELGCLMLMVYGFFGLPIMLSLCVYLTHYVLGKRLFLQYLQSVEDQQAGERLIKKSARILFLLIIIPFILFLLHGV